MTRLIEASDRDFARMLGGKAPTPALRLPPGGVNSPEVLKIVRGMARTVRASHDRGAWMIADGDEIVGLCSYKRPPSPAGEVEIGYGVATSRRSLGHATRAVAILLIIAEDDPAVSVVIAVTSIDNLASQTVLVRNGFVEIARYVDPEDGHVIRWRCGVLR